MKAPSSLRELSYKPSTGPFIFSQFSTQLLQGNDFKTVTLPLFFSLNLTDLSLAGPQGALLPNCLWAFESKVRMNEKGGTECGCITPSDWSELAPEWLLYMEKWKCLHNHVRKLEESISWGRGFLPWGISVFSSNFPRLSIWSVYGEESCIDSAELKLFWASVSSLQLSPYCSKVNIPCWRVGALGYSGIQTGSKKLFFQKYG